MRDRLLEFGSVIGSAGAALTSSAASICCIGPIAISILGVNGAILAAGIKPYRFYILAGSLLMLGFAFWTVYGRKKARAGAACSVSAGRVTKIVLWVAAVMWLAAVVIQFAADRYWL